MAAFDIDDLFDLSKPLPIIRIPVKTRLVAEFYRNKNCICITNATQVDRKIGNTIHYSVSTYKFSKSNIKRKEKEQIMKTNTSAYPVINFYRKFGDIGNQK